MKAVVLNMPHHRKLHWLFNSSVIVKTIFFRYSKERTTGTKTLRLLKVIWKKALIKSAGNSQMLIVMLLADENFSVFLINELARAKC